MKLISSDISEPDVPLFAAAKERSPLTILVAVVFAAAIVCGLFYAYLYLRNRHAAQFPTNNKVLTNPECAALAALPLRAQIAQDEAWAKNGQAIIGGTVHNISKDKLSNLIVELEMKRREDGQTESRLVEVMPKNLEPEEQGKFSLRVPSREYSGLRIVRLKDEANSMEIGFTTVHGAARPLERAPQTKTIIIQRPATRTRDGEFLNTPDNPEVIR